LLFNCQQHSDLYEHSTRRAPLGRRDSSCQTAAYQLESSRTA
jgi:hypothetical protein